jgi:hypothetical protein
MSRAPIRAHGTIGQPTSLDRIVAGTPVFSSATRTELEPAGCRLPDGAGGHPDCEWPGAEVIGGELVPCLPGG